MEIKKIKKTTKQIELEIIGENETILNPIKERLLKNEKVDYATITLDHPQSKKRNLYLRLKPGEKVKPEELIDKTVKELEDEIKNFKEKIAK